MGTARFSGNGNYYVDIDAAVASQNYANNTSVIYWRIIVTKTAGTGYWSNAAGGNNGYVDSNIGRVWTGGNIAYNFQGSTPKSVMFADGTYTITHDGNGYANYEVAGGMNLVNLGSANAGSGVKSAPRIPKVPGAPTPIGIDQVDGDSLRYRFSGTTDGGSTIREWQAQIATNSGFTTGVQTVGSGGTTTFSGLNNHTTYWVHSRGRNDVGWSAWSSPSSATTLGHPTAPQGLSATASTSVSKRIALSWSAPATPGAGGIVGYNIFRDGTQIATTTGTGTTYTDNTPAGLTTYSYTVAARNAYSTSVSGIGPKSAADTAVSPAPPSAPRNLTATASPTIPGQVALAWTAPASPGAGGITGYRVRRSEGTLVVNQNGTGLSYTVTGLAPGSTYTFKVSGRNALSDAEGSEGVYSATATVTPIGEPGAPTNVTVTPSTATNNRLTVSWTAPPGTMSGYTIYRRQGGADTFVRAIPSTFTSTPIDNLTAGESYSYVVRARTAYTDTLPASDPVSAGGPASAPGTGVPSNNSSQTVPSLGAASSSTNVSFAGTKVINAVTAKTIGYSTTGADVSSIASGGSIANSTTALFNGTTTITSTTVSSITYAKTGTVTLSAAVGGVSDNTNTSLNGSYAVTTVNPGANLVSYAQVGADITTRAVPVNTPPGQSSTIVNRSNAYFNGTGKVLLEVTPDTLTYAQAGPDTPQGNATGTVENATNRDTFNGTFIISSLPEFNAVRYARSGANIATRTWDEPTGSVYRAVSPGVLDLHFRSGWAG